MGIICLVPGCIDIFLKLGEIRERKQLQAVTFGRISFSKGFVLIWLVRFLRVARERHFIIRDGNER